MEICGCYILAIEAKYGRFNNTHQIDVGRKKVTTMLTGAKQRINNGAKVVEGRS